MTATVDEDAPRRRRPTRMTLARFAFAAPGIALGLYGAYRLLTQISEPNLIALAEWMVGALIVHDLLLSPSFVVIGRLLSYLPRRARRHIQGGLLAGGLVTVIALPLIHRQGALPRSYLEEKALLLRDYRVSLAVLLAVVATATLLLYLLHVIADARAATPDTDPDAADPVR